MFTRKNLLGLLLSIILSATAIAQGIYVEANLGYGFPISSNTDMLSNYNSTTIQDFDNNDFSFTDTEEIVKLNLGKGFSFGGTFGYMFNDIFGVEMQLSYLIGGKTTAESVSRTTTISGGMTTSETFTSQLTYSSTMFRAIPSIVVQGDFRGINPYAKFGVLLGFGNSKLQQDENLGGFTTALEAKLNGGVAIGVNSRIGVMYTTDNDITYFVEASVIAMNYCPTKGEITKLVSDGNDVIGDLTTSEREVEFVDSITTSDEAQEDPNKPSQSLKMALPYSSIGINIGVRFSFGN